MFKISPDKLNKLVSVNRVELEPQEGFFEDLEKQLEKQQEQNLELEKLRLEVDDLRANVKIKNSNHSMRFCLSIYLLIISSVWLIFIGYIIYNIGKTKLIYDASVAVAIVTSSLATVLGLWGISLRYFFKEKQD